MLNTLSQQESQRKSGGGGGASQCHKVASIDSDSGERNGRGHLALERTTGSVMPLGTPALPLHASSSPPDFACKNLFSRLPILLRLEPLAEEVRNCCMLAAPPPSPASGWSCMFRALLCPMRGPHIIWRSSSLVSAVIQSWPASLTFTWYVPRNCAT